MSVNVWEDLGQDVATGEALAPLLAIFGVVPSGGEEVLGALLYQDGIYALLTDQRCLSAIPASTYSPWLLSSSIPQP